VQARRRRWSTISRKPAKSITGDSAHSTSHAVDGSNAFGAQADDEEIPVAIEDDASEEHEARVGGQTVIPTGSAETGARNRPHDAGSQVDASNSVIERIPDNECRVAVGEQDVRAREGRADRRPTITREIPDAVSGNRRYDPGNRIHAPDALVLCVGDEEVSLGIDGEPEWSVELRRRRRSAVATEPWLAGTRHRGNDAGLRVDAPNAIVPYIPDVQASVQPDSEAIRL
jgi:hypothetical protein